MIPVAIEMIGFLAAAATVTAFSCRQMISLRIAAIAANSLFIAYGALLGLAPILALHCLLLLLNIRRLLHALQENRPAGHAGPPMVPPGTGRAP
ncbi:MAG: hypothetical protein NTZ14_02660 [Hyphomicrobiales bacterium]|nr:hypothetical protein [Hyphomicrobiales bacterium]